MSVVVQVLRIKGQGRACRLGSIQPPRVPKGQGGGVRRGLFSKEEKEDSEEGSDGSSGD